MISRSIFHQDCKQILAILMCVCMFPGCSSRQQAPVQLAHEDVQFGNNSDEFIGLPTDMCIHDGQLLVADARNSNCFHWYNLKTMTYMGSFGKKGMGPGEFVMPMYLSVYNGAFYTYDMHRRKLVRIDANLTSDKLDFTDVLTMPKGSDHDVAVPVSDNTFACNGSYEEGMIKIVGSNGNTLSSSEDYPQGPDDVNVPNISRSMAYQGRLRFNGKDKLVYAVSRAKQWMVFSLSKDGKLEKAAESIEAYPDYTDESSDDDISVSLSKDSPYGYSCVWAGRDNFWVSYSGVSYNEDKELFGKSKTLFCMDYDGRTRQTYELDIPVSIFAVDDMTGMVYAISFNPEPTLIRFKP